MFHIQVLNLVSDVLVQVYFPSILEDLASIHPGAVRLIFPRDHLDGWQFPRGVENMALGE